MSLIGKDAAVDEVFAEWMRRLRSGDYTQTQGQLCVSFPDRQRSYCCLGVLTQMAVEAGLVTEVVEPVVKYFPAGNTDVMPEESGLIEVVCEWAGIGTTGAQFRGTPVVPESAPEYEYGLASEAPDSLIAANDLLNYNFSQIADLAELNREALR